MAEPTLGTSRPASPRRRDWQILIDSAWFPVVVWAVWRLAQLIALVAVGGHPVGDTFRFDAAWYRSILAQGYHYDAPSTRPAEPGVPTRPAVADRAVLVGARRQVGGLPRRQPDGPRRVRRRLVGAAHVGRRSVRPLRHHRPGAVAHLALPVGLLLGGPVRRRHRGGPRRRAEGEAVVGRRVCGGGRGDPRRRTAVRTGAGGAALVAGTAPRPDRLPLPRGRRRGRGARHRRPAGHHRPRLRGAGAAAPRLEPEPGTALGPDRRRRRQGPRQAARSRPSRCS